jgi:hypothetical protein
MLASLCSFNFLFKQAPDKKNVAGKELKKKNKTSEADKK